MKKGLKKGSEKTAMKLLKLNVAKDIIMEATGLSESELEKLEKDGCND